MRAYKFGPSNYPSFIAGALRAGLLSLAACSGSFVFNGEDYPQGRREVPSIAATTAENKNAEVAKGLIFTLSPSPVDSKTTATLSRDDALQIIFKGVKIDPYAFANHGDNFDVVMKLHSVDVFVDEVKNIFENHAEMTFEIDLREEDDILAARKFHSDGYVVVSNKDGNDELVGRIVSDDAKVGAPVSTPSPASTAAAKLNQVRLYVFLTRTHAATHEEALRNVWHGGYLSTYNRDAEFRLGSLDTPQ